MENIINCDIVTLHHNHMKIRNELEMKVVLMKRKIIRLGGHTLGQNSQYDRVKHTTA